VFALSLGGVAAVAKNTREAMLDVMTSEHIRVAAANGVPARAIYLRYALKNAAGRIATILGLITVGLLAGTVLVETVFALPGLGAALVTAIDQHDLPTVQGIAVFFTAIVVLVNLAIDLSYIALDPRVRMR
jgi:peptide/nickel transport system permease protein